MGNYIAQGDLDEYLSDEVLRQLTDDDDSGTIDTTIVDEAIAGAEDEVDGYLRKRYVVPITGTVPGIITEVAVQLATLRLYVRRQRVPTHVVDMAKHARELLEKILDGTIRLDVTETAAGRGDIYATFNERVHTRTTWSGS